MYEDASLGDLNFTIDEEYEPEEIALFKERLGSDHLYVTGFDRGNHEESYDLMLRFIELLKKDWGGDLVDNILP